MNDALLEMADNVSLPAVLQDFSNAVAFPTIAALLYVSDAVPVADLGGVAVGHEGVTLQMSCTEDFIEAAGAVTVEWKLVSVASQASLALEVLVPSFNVHWQSGPTAASSYVRGRRMFTVPLPPTKSYKAQLVLLGYFTDAGSPMDGLSAGSINVRLCGTPDTAAQYPFPNAI